MHRSTQHRSSEQSTIDIQHESTNQAIGNLCQFEALSPPILMLVFQYLSFSYKACTLSTLSRHMAQTVDQQCFTGGTWHITERVLSNVPTTISYLSRFCRVGALVDASHKAFVSVRYGKPTDRAHLFMLRFLSVLQSSSKSSLRELSIYGAYADLSDLLTSRCCSKLVSLSLSLVSYDHADPSYDLTGMFLPNLQSFVLQDEYETRACDLKEHGIISFLSLNPSITYISHARHIEADSWLQPTFLPRLKKLRLMYSELDAYLSGLDGIPALIACISNRSIESIISDDFEIDDLLTYCLSSTSLVEFGWQCNALSSWINVINSFKANSVSFPFRLESLTLEVPRDRGLSELFHSLQCAFGGLKYLKLMCPGLINGMQDVEVSSLESLTNLRILILEGALVPSILLKARLSSLTKLRALWINAVHMSLDHANRFFSYMHSIPLTDLIIISKGNNPYLLLPIVAQHFQYLEQLTIHEREPVERDPVSNTVDLMSAYTQLSAGSSHWFTRLNSLRFEDSSNRIVPVAVMNQFLSLLRFAPLRFIALSKGYYADVVNVSRLSHFNTLRRIDGLRAATSPAVEMYYRQANQCTDTDNLPHYSEKFEYSFSVHESQEIPWSPWFGKSKLLLLNDEPIHYIDRMPPLEYWRGCLSYGNEFVPRIFRSDHVYPSLTGQMAYFQDLQSNMSHKEIADLHEYLCSMSDSSK